uniref:Uncharacterized protein n=1 Tax=Caenorhabditis tropicalis TaxID=1561998 RepID=A0A1I7T134_9PELO
MGVRERRKRKEKREEMKEKRWKLLKYELENYVSGKRRKLHVSRIIEETVEHQMEYENHESQIRRKIPKRFM